MPRKNYNGVSYDTDLDYTAEIQKAAASGNNARAAVLERERNAKIAGEGLDYGTTSDYVQYLPQPTGVSYDMNTDYMALMNEAARRGDYTAAYNYENQRNAKITGEALDTPTTSTYARYNPDVRYKYDPTQDENYMRLKNQQDAIFERIMNMGEFNYDAENDPLYQQYRRQYMRQGQQAMRDTMGQAAALTGGYGNTYAQRAGEQAYEAYLSRLNDVMPELYGEAYNRYRTQRNDLLAEYQLAQGNANTAYERGREDWSTRLGLERQDEDNAYTRRMAEEERDYQRAQLELERQRQAEETAYTRGQNEREHLESLILSTGYQPTAAEMQAAGMTQAEVTALYNQWLFNRQQSFNSGGSGGGRSGRRSSGGRRRSGGGGGGSAQVNPTNDGSSGGGGKGMSDGAFSNLQRQIAAYINKGDRKTAEKLIANARSRMSDEQYASLLRWLSKF